MLSSKNERQNNHGDLLLVLLVQLHGKTSGHISEYVIPILLRMRWLDCFLSGIRYVFGEAMQRTIGFQTITTLRWISARVVGILTKCQWLCCHKDCHISITEWSSNVFYASLTTLPLKVPTQLLCYQNKFKCPVISYQHLGRIWFTWVLKIY